MITVIRMIIKNYYELAHLSVAAVLPDVTTCPWPPECSNRFRRWGSDQTLPGCWPEEALQCSLSREAAWKCSN